MTTATLTTLPDNYPCPFEKLYKIYNDGSHYIAREAVKGISRRQREKRMTEIDELFESLYDMASKNLIDEKNDKTKEARVKKLSAFILTNLQDSFPYYPDIEKYVRENVERKERNLWQREKRFRRKAYLNRWNYFVTFTYRDGMHTEETFRKKLRKCLANLAYAAGLELYGRIRARQRKRQTAFPLSVIRSRRTNDRYDYEKAGIQQTFGDGERYVLKQFL